ncbi:hypothetical protein [Natronomonas amylolytica]|uniref:hypothetical protein n=1 Tax=Natronomonas amylolytica TaxID=3108498 RepID=UPI003008AB46
MSPTVHELRNGIRASVGRFKREVSAQFTKEELAAIVEAVGGSVDSGRPSKTTMRADIRRRTGLDEGEDADGSAFTKVELEAIAGTLGEDGR